MNEVDAFAEDRRRYRIHAATALVALPGLPLCGFLARIIDDRVVVWIALGFAVMLAVSGAFAISVKRTIFSKRADDTKGLELDADPGDALYTPGLWTFDLFPWVSNAVAPYGILASGLVGSILLLVYAVL